jgi:hypothetical protein
MPRYFFDFCEGRAHSPDLDGNEFANVDAAHSEACKAAEEMWGDLISRRIDPRRCAFEVRGPDRSLLFIMSFHEILENCRNSRAPTPFFDTLRESMANIGYARQVSEGLQRELEATRNTLNEAIALITTPV